jgi:hypothetical protein
MVSHVEVNQEVEMSTQRSEIEESQINSFKDLLDEKKAL